MEGKENIPFPPRYYYPFPPVGPMLYHMELSVGGQQFIGKGRTRQLAKHDAAAKALKVLHKEPILQQVSVVRKVPFCAASFTIISRFVILFFTKYLLLFTDEWRARRRESQ